MTITQLEYIVAVDTYRSFVMAAEQCSVTQPTLSIQVQKLEETLGVKIFDRAKQPVTPTDIGAEIIAQARVLLAESEKIKEIVTDTQHEPSGELTIGIIPTVAPFIIPQILKSFAGRYPQVTLRVFELRKNQLVSELKLGKIDCGILSTPLHDTALIVLPLYYESFVAYLGKDSKLHKKKHVSAGDIDFDELWLISEEHCMRSQVLDICRHHKNTHGAKHFEYNPGSVEALKRMVDLTGGATLLPELAIADLNDKHLDKLRYFKSPGPAREISIVIQKNFTKRRLIEALKSEILEFLPKRLKSRKKKEIVEG